MTFRTVTDRVRSIKWREAAGALPGRARRASGRALTWVKMAVENCTSIGARLIASNVVIALMLAASRFSMLVG